MSSTRLRVQAAVPTCLDHPNEDLDSYCDTCNARICEICCKEKHKAHEWRRAKKIVREVRKNAHARCNEIEDIIAEMNRKKEASSSLIKSNLKGINAQRKLLKALIKVHTEELKSKVKERKETKELLSKGIKDFSLILDFFKHQLISADDNVVVEMEEEFHKMKELYSESQTRERKLKFIEGQVDHEALTEMFGRVIETSKLEMEVTETTYFSHGGNTSVLRLQTLINDEAILYIREEKQIDKINTSGTVCVDRRLPSSIKDFVLISKNNEIMYIIASEQMIHSLSSSGEPSEMYSTDPWYPSCLSTSRKGGILVGLSESSYPSSSSKGEIHHINNSGILLQRYSRTEGEETNLITSPKRIAHNVNNDICLIQYLDKEYKSGLLVLSSLSKFRYTYSGMPQLPGFEPVDVCCDHLARILLCDSKNNSVHLIHEDGDFLQYVVTQNPLFGPRSIALLCNTMWLGCYDGKIRLYKYGKNSE